MLYVSFFVSTLRSAIICIQHITDNSISIPVCDWSSHPHSLCRVLTPTFLLFDPCGSSWFNRKVKDTLPLFRQFFSSAFSLTHVSLASMKLPPDVLRYLTCRLQFSCPHVCSFHLNSNALEAKRDVQLFQSGLYFSLTTTPLPPHRAVLTGLTSNPHITDLHLDISGCEVRASFCPSVVFIPVITQKQ